MFKFYSLVNRKVKRNISLKYIKELEDYMGMYEDRYFKRLVSLTKRPKRLLGKNGSSLLLNCLQRSRALFIGLVDSMNQQNSALAFLAVRAHFETTGSVAYFLTHLEKFYKDEITYAAMDKVLHKLIMGAKRFPESKKKDPRWADAINVLTLIDTADKLFNEIVIEKEKPFRDSYEFLSEFCHPNLFGLRVHTELYASEIPDWENFPKSYVFKKRDYGVLIGHLIISCHFFFLVYDKSFSLIKKNEEIPKLYRN